jgi:archaellin
VCVETHDASENLTLLVEINLGPVEIKLVRVKITLCINTQARRYHTRECHIHTYTSQHYSRVSENHTMCRSRTLRVEINLVRV